MKWIPFLLVCVFCLMHGGEVQGQYRLNKQLYDYRDYQWERGDAYHPAAAGLLSAFLPGLGQVYASEPLRGAVFFTTTVGGSALYVGSLIAMFGGFETLGPFSDEALPLLFATGGIIAGGAYWWSIGDAVRVAKVNSLAARHDDFLSHVRGGPTLLHHPMATGPMPGFRIIIQPGNWRCSPSAPGAVR